MRLVYLDEAGVSRRGQEPYLVVAGIIVSPDHHWRPLEAHIRKLAVRYAPDQDPYRFIFHAHELFHGSGYFHRQTWEKDERWKILKTLAAIPKKFELPVIVGWLRRSRVEVYIGEGMSVPKEGNTEQWYEAMAHAAAIRLAAKSIEGWMATNAQDELATIIAEDRKGVKSAVRFVHSGYTSQRPYESSDGLVRPEFKSKHIIETVHFANKSESIILQIADTCAFLIKRQLMRRPDAAEFYPLLESQIVRYSPKRAWRMISLEEISE